MGWLDRKVALVTGAGSGLGRHYALALAAEGAHVVVNDVGAAVDGDLLGNDSARRVVEEIEATGGRAVPDSSSVASWDGAHDMVEAAIDGFGRLDIVVNNAGNNRPSSLVNLGRDDVDRVIDTHLKGTIAVSHFASKVWASTKEASPRAIVNTTSAVGLHPTEGAGVYGAAKAGIAAVTVSHALELARFGVRVNAIAPCARTRMVEASPTVLDLMPTTDGFDRHLPDHVAPLVVYLASESCQFTGRVFAIEGPDLAIYRPFDVEASWMTEGPWTMDQLVRVLDGVEPRSVVTGFFPGGIAPYALPPGRTLRALKNKGSH